MTVTIQDVIRIKVTDTMKSRAKYTAYMKATHTMNTWLRKRTPQERFVTLYEGDLAKLALKEFLKSYSVQCEDYDEVRDDDFRYRDKWDLRVKGCYLIEIKSSVESKVCDVETVLHQRRYMVYPRREAHMNVQAYYIPLHSGFDLIFANFIKNMNEIRKLRLDDVSELLRKKLDVVFLMGWINKEDLQSKPIIIMEPTLEGERPRQQYDVKIYEGRRMSELPRYIQKLTHLD